MCVCVCVCEYSVGLHNMFNIYHMVQCNRLPLGTQSTENSNYRFINVHAIWDYRQMALLDGF